MLALVSILQLAGAFCLSGWLAAQGVAELEAADGAWVGAPALELGSPAQEVGACGEVEVKGLAFHLGGEGPVGEEVAQELEVLWGIEEVGGHVFEAGVVQEGLEVSAHEGVAAVPADDLGEHGPESIFLTWVCGGYV